MEKEKQINQLEENNQTTPEVQPIINQDLSNPEVVEVTHNTFVCKLSSYRYDVTQLSQLAFNFWEAVNNPTKGKEGKNYFN